MLAEMSVVVVGGVGMKCIPRPSMFLASVGTSYCAVRSWRVELCGLLFCWRRFVFRRALMALRSGEMDGSRMMLYLFVWQFVAEEAICVVWLATYLASASACRLVEHCQEQCWL